MTGSISAPGAHDDRRATEVYFDGACPVCSREIAMYQRSLGDRHVAWQDLTSAGDQVAPDLTREQAIARFHVRRADGSLASGAGAFLAIWRNSERLRWLAAALDRQPFLWFGDRLYSLFLAIRPLWRRTG